jgi:hypothetical protein
MVTDFSDIQTDLGEDFPQDDDLDDTHVPASLPSGALPISPSGSPVISFDPNALAVLQAMNKNFGKMAKSLEKLDTIENSMIHMAVAFENLAKVLSERK